MPEEAEEKESKSVPYNQTTHEQPKDDAASPEKEATSADQEKATARALDSDTQVFEVDVEKSSRINIKNLSIVIIVILLLAGGGIGGYLFLQNRKTDSGGGIKPVPSISEEEASEATGGAVIEEEEESSPEAKTTSQEIQLSEYSVNVLNGSGVPGEAGAVQTMLQDQGFEDLSADNADNYDYKATEIKSQKEVPQTVIEQIKAALSNDFQKISVVEDKLAEDSEYDLQVIIGIRKDQEDSEDSS